MVLGMGDDICKIRIKKDKLYVYETNVAKNVCMNTGIAMFG